MKKTIISTIVLSAFSTHTFALSTHDMLETDKLSIAEKNSHLIGLNAEAIENIQKTSIHLFTVNVDANKEINNRIDKSKSDIDNNASKLSTNQQLISDNSNSISKNSDDIQKNLTSASLAIAGVDLAIDKTRENQKSINTMNQKIEAIQATKSNGASNEEVAKVKVKVDTNNHQIRVNEARIEDAESNLKAQADNLDDNNEKIAKNNERLDTHEKVLEKHHKSIYGTLEGFSAQISSQSKNLTAQADQTATNTANIKKNSNDIADLRQDFERMSKEYAGGIAGVAAMANVPHTYGNGDLSVGAGIGHFSGESAVAVSVGYRVTDSITTQLGVSANSGNNIAPVFGAGVSMSL